MKPVNKGVAPRTYSDHKTAKPDLINNIGKHCSYCESAGKAQALDVEHIYPQKAHPNLDKNWRNFLLSCSTCNTYKRHYQGSAKQKRLLKNHVWPHLDNTFRAFTYKDTGEVDIAPTVPAALIPIVEAMRDMVGLLRSPAVAEIYQTLGIAYDGANLRTQQWAMAERFRDMYIGNRTPEHASTLADGAAEMGYFSVWMEVFKDYKEMRSELIRSFKADPACFDSQTLPIPKGRF